jgi:hypothetical protein
MVSFWIRDVVDQEVLRRERSRTVGTVKQLRWERRPNRHFTSSTVASSAEDLDELRDLLS